MTFTALLNLVGTILLYLCWTVLGITAIDYILSSPITTKMTVRRALLVLLLAGVFAGLSYVFVHIDPLV